MSNGNLGAADAPLMLPSPQGRPVRLNELAAYTQQELQQSQNWAGSEWRESIKQSLNYLLLRLKGDEVEGRSQIQSGDVADVLDHVQAEMQPMYAVEELVTIGPEGPDDEQQAEQETRAVNWYFRERARGFEILDSAIQDALLSRNGYLMVWYEESFGLPYEEVIEGERIQIDAQINALQEENLVEILDEEIIEPALVQSAPVPVPTGEIVEVSRVVKPEIWRVTLSCIPQRKEVKIASPAPEDMFVSKDASDNDMQKPRFVSYRRRMTRQNVKALGFDELQVDRMPSTSAYDSDVRTARKSDYNTYTRHAPHHSGTMTDLFMCYYKIDRDGDGIPELWKFYYSSNKEILNWRHGEPAIEKVRVRPFACGSPLKVAHRHQGRSIFDKQKEIEDTSRELTRQMLNNLYLANDPSLVVGPGVSSDDLEDTDVTRIIRAQDVSQVQPVQFHNITPDSLAGLAYMDKKRKERTGGSIEMSSEDMPVARAAHTTERMMSAKETMVAMFARNLANTLIRDTFVLLHQQLQLLPGKIAFETRGKWEETRPRDWVERNRLTVTLGMSMGEKMRRQQGQQSVIGIQREDMQLAPDVLVDFQAMYESRVDYARSWGLPDPEQYWVNPSEPIARDEQGQPITRQQRFMAQREQQARQQAEMQAQMLKMQQDTALRITQMQEMTKRISDENDKLEAQRDRLAKMLEAGHKLAAQYAEMALKYGVSVPGLEDALEEGVEGEVIELRRS